MTAGERKQSILILLWETGGGGEDETTALILSIHKSSHHTLLHAQMFIFNLNSEKPGLWWASHIKQGEGEQTPFRPVTWKVWDKTEVEKLLSFLKTF